LDTNKENKIEKKRCLKCRSLKTTKQNERRAKNHYIDEINEEKRCSFLPSKPKRNNGKETKENYNTNRMAAEKTTATIMKGRQRKTTKLIDTIVKQAIRTTARIMKGEWGQERITRQIKFQFKLLSKSIR